MEEKKEYIVVYRSEEHFEVLGFVNAENMEEAKRAALTELATEAEYYDVAEADISEYPSAETINFK
jgi:predicted transcriptional regulator